MHIPDGFLNGGTSLGGGVMAVGGVAYGIRRTKAILADRAIALAGLVSAYVFAVQMLNFPVAAGTSGHVLGGTLAAVLVGPWVGALCVAVVVGVQALVFADGGLSALGLNIVNIALVGALGGYLIFWAVVRAAGHTRRGVLVAVAVSSWCAPVMAAIAFTVEYAIGGYGTVASQTVLVAMVGVHSLIGVGEAVITTMTVAAVLASRPDLVFGARRIRADTGPVPAGRRPILVFSVIAVVMTSLVVLGATRFASTKPDGLERVAASTGIGTDDSADSTDTGVDRVDTSVGAIAIAGVVVVGGLGGLGLFRRRSIQGFG